MPRKGQLSVAMAIERHGYTIWDMAPKSVPDAASEANERIRAFMAARASRALSPEEQAEYEQLLADWADSVPGRPASS